MRKGEAAGRAKGKQKKGKKGAGEGAAAPAGKKRRGLFPPKQRTKARKTKGLGTGGKLPEWARAMIASGDSAQQSNRPDMTCHFAECHECGKSCSGTDYKRVEGFVTMHRIQHSIEARRRAA